MHITKISNNLIIIKSSLMNNNSFILIKNKKAIVVDPSFSSKEIIKLITDNNWTLQTIILTHAHFDHTFSCYELTNLYKCPVFLHKLDFVIYSEYDCGNLMNKPIKKFDQYIKFFNNKKIKLFDDLIFDVVLSPGHTPGSVVYKFRNYVFTGDTLFYDGIGRTDFPYGNELDMKKSLNNLYKILKDEDIILPGHGQWGNFKYLKKNNIFVSSFLNDK